MVCPATCVPVYTESLKKAKLQKGSISFCNDTTDVTLLFFIKTSKNILHVLWISLRLASLG